MHYPFPKSKQIRGLVDCDSFYASCETYLNPKLRWLPVCIWGDIVIARSYEAKPYDIKVGTPMREAKKMLPKNAVYLKPRMKEYGKISQSLMQYMKEKCLQVEVFSIDEAFFDITWYAKRYDMSYARIARALKNDIRKKIWIPTSIGIWPTRLLGKIFAEVNKPFWECIALEEKAIDAVLQTLPLKDVPFIWPKSQEKLQYRCKTAYDFKALPYAYVKQLLWKNGLTVRLELNGTNATTYKSKEKPKGISRTRSFNPHFTNKKQDIRPRLLNNIEKAIEHMMDMKLKVWYIKIHFRTKSFDRFWYDKRVWQPLNDWLQIVKICRELFEQCPFDDVLYRTTWVFFGELVDAHSMQWSLFDYPKEENTKKKSGAKESLNHAIHKLNKKFGRWSVHIWACNQTVAKKNDIFVMEVW